MEYRVLKSDEMKMAFALREEVFVDEQKVPLEYEIDHKDIVYFGRACVKKSCRGKGVGKFLFINMEETVKKYKKENEKKIIRFSAQYHAMTFYEMLGYSKDNDDIFVEVGIEHISMSKIV